MIHEETRRKLRELNLEELIDVLDIQGQDPSYLSTPVWRSHDSGGW